MATFANAVNAIYQGLLKLIRFIVIALSAFLCGAVFTSVVTRYVFNASLTWIEEISRFIFVWITFLGAVLVNDTFSHMSVDIILQHSPKLLKLLLQMIATVIVIVVLYYLIIGGYVMTMGGLTWFSPALEIPYGVVNGVIPFSCAIMLLQSIVALFRFGAEFIREVKGGANK